jgi:hypothetical protein
LVGINHLAIGVFDNDGDIELLKRELPQQFRRDVEAETVALLWVFCGKMSGNLCRFMFSVMIIEPYCLLW